jgi:hypothetical protein
MLTTQARWAAIAALLIGTTALADVHGAGTPGDSREYRRGVRRGPRVRTYARGRYVSPGYMRFGVRVYSPPPVYAVPRTDSAAEEYVPAPTRRRSNPAASGVVLGEVAGYGRAASLGVFAAVEGERVGVSAALNGYSMWTPDWQPYRKFGTLGMNLTLAVVSTEKFRWRLEGGAETAWFANSLMLGPAFGTSLGAHIAGPLGIEGGLWMTPVPYQKVEARAGIFLNFGALLVRAGWRTVVMSDAGFVDGYIHRDVLTGPTVSLGVTF